MWVDTCALAGDGNKAYECLVEFVAIRVLYVQMVSVWTLGEGTDMALKQQLGRTPKKRTEPKIALPLPGNNSGIFKIPITWGEIYASYGQRVIL